MAWYSRPEWFHITDHGSCASKIQLQKALPQLQNRLKQDQAVLADR